MSVALLSQEGSLQIAGIYYVQLVVEQEHLSPQSHSFPHAKPAA